MTDTILVTGASGHFGRAVLAHLLAMPGQRKLVAATRDPSRLADLAKKGIETRRADFDDPASLSSAFAGIDRLLMVSTDRLGAQGERLRQHRNAVAAARDAGVRHVVYTSMPDPKNALVSFAPDHLGTEEAIAASGLDHTILRNNWYMETLLMRLPQAFATGKWYSAAGSGRIAYAARADLASAAAHALVEGKGKTVVELGGPAAYSADEVAALASRIVGRPIEIVHVDDSSLAAGMKAAGVPEFLVPMLVSFDANARSGHQSHVTGELERLTGGKPRTLEAFLQENRAALVG